jgi:hypothetical protein
MACIKKDFNYKIIKNFLNESEINLLQNYCKNIHRTNTENFDFVQNNNGDTFMYNDPLMESLTVNKLSLMEKESGLKLFPTYSFWRLYTYGAALDPHKDRPSCEISVTVQIDSDGTEWPIWFTKPNGEQISYNLKPGQGVVYLGMKSEHWRDAFKGQEYGQVFLHYVRGRGEHWDCYFDKKKK